MVQRVSTVAFIFLLSLLIPVQAHADRGIKMLAFKCDGAAPGLVIQPFILWNENYNYQGIKLESPQKKPLQSSKSYTFFSAQSFEKKILASTCRLQGRNIKLFLQREMLTIVDIKDDASWAKEINLSTETGAAWDVSGPLYQIRSSQFRNWETCRARDDVDAKDAQYSCTLIAGAKE